MNPLIIAHCGDTQQAPESTLIAFERAIRQGADSIECDLHLSKDGEFVIHHDYYLGRTTAGQGYIGDYTCAELQALDAGSWFHPQFADQRIPTLPEVLALGKSRVRFELELRTPTRYSIQRLIHILDQFGVIEDVEVTSPHTALLWHLRQHCPALRVGLFARPFPEWMSYEVGQFHLLQELEFTDAQVAHLPYSMLSTSLVDYLHTHHILVHGANLTTPHDIGQGIQAGVDQFSTDHIAQAIALRNAMVETSPGTRV